MWGSNIFLKQAHIRNKADKKVIMMQTDSKSNMSIEERNKLVTSYLWCIDSVIRQNYSLVQTAHLDKDDVYQDLALRLIRAVERYRPGSKSLKGYIFTQLKLELLRCKSARAPYDLRGAIVSMEKLAENAH